MRPLDRLAATLRHLTKRQQLVLIGVLVGVSSGLATFGFVRLIEFSWNLTLRRLPQELGFWRLIGLMALPGAGALLGAAFLHLFCPEAKGHGVNQVTEAMRERGGRISGSVAWGTLVASGLTIGFGGSAGREGPAIHIGGAVGSWLGRLFKLESEELKMLVAAGASAGLGAAFGVPLASVFFTMEVILSDFGAEAFPAVVIAAVSGTATAQLLIGRPEGPGPLALSWSGPAALPFFAVVGLICGLCGMIYMRLLEAAEKYCERAHPGPYWLRPTLGGLLTGMIGWWLPEVMGTGQSTIEAAITGRTGGWRAAALAAGKTLATAATLGTGGSGGAFMPAMFIGATAGSACRSFFAALGWKFQPGSLALPGMACAVASAYQAPVTAIIMALEISRDYDLLMPVMVACAAAYLTTPRARRQPVLQQ